MNAKERVRMERKIEDRKRMIQIEEMKRTVSYTHLTLPTIYSV